MQEAFGFLDNREKAVLFWIVVGAVLAIRSKAVRASLLPVFQTLLSRPIVIGLAAMTGYVSVMVLAICSIGLWATGLTKDTVIWFFGPAMVMVFNHTDANKDSHFFVKRFLASLEFSVLLAFLVNFYVFHIFVELLLVPVLFFIGALLVVSGTKQEFVAVKRLMEVIAAIAGIAFVSYAMARIIGDAGSFASEDTLKLFALPVILTVLFLPFVYALAVYSGYELIFLRAGIWIGDRELAGFIKMQIFQACLLRLGRVNRFLNNYVTKLNGVRSRTDAIELIAEFRAG